MHRREQHEREAPAREDDDVEVELERLNARLAELTRRRAAAAELWAVVERIRDLRSRS